MCQKRLTPGRFYQSPHSGSTARELGHLNGGLFVFLRSPDPENPALVVCGAKTHQTAARNTRVACEGERARDNPKAENAADVLGLRHLAAAARVGAVGRST